MAHIRAWAWRPGSAASIESKMIQGAFASARTHRSVKNIERLAAFLKVQVTNAPPPPSSPPSFPP